MEQSSLSKPAALPAGFFYLDSPEFPEENRIDGNSAGCREKASRRKLELSRICFDSPEICWLDLHEDLYQRRVTRGA